MTVSEQSWELRFGTVVPVWGLSLLSGLAIWLLSTPESFLTWISIALAGAILLTFCIQLSIQIKDGFVQRSVASIGGSLLVFVFAAGVFELGQLLGLFAPLGG